MTDSEREEAIRRYAALAERCMEHAEKDSLSYFLWRGAADWCRLEMESLIKGRSSEQVFLMEAQRGIV